MFHVERYKGKVMISLTIKPEGAVDLDEGVYLDAIIDNAHEDGRIEVLVEPHEVDADYSTIVDSWMDEAHGAKFLHKIKSIHKVRKVQWMGHDVLNAEDVCYELEEQL